MEEEKEKDPDAIDPDKLDDGDDAVADDADDLFGDDADEDEDDEDVGGSSLLE